jgi:hypothetical protein
MSHGGPRSPLLEVGYAIITDMNPDKLPAPQIRPESQPVAPEHTEHLLNQEAVGEQSHEREQNMQQVDRQLAPPVPVPLPQMHVPVPVPAAPQPVDDTTAGPAIASDDDLIEKEWVDKAKKIIAETQNDPYRREQQVTKLQVDYLRKRYGKELGTSN